MIFQYIPPSSSPAQHFHDHLVNAQSAPLPVDIGDRLFVAVLLYRVQGPEGRGSAHPEVANRPRSNHPGNTPEGGQTSSGMTRCPCSPLRPPTKVTPDRLLFSPNGFEKDRIWGQVRILTV